MWSVLNDFLMKITYLIKICGLVDSKKLYIFLNHILHVKNAYSSVFTGTKAPIGSKYITIKNANNFSKYFMIFFLI